MIHAGNSLWVRIVNDLFLWTLWRNPVGSSKRQVEVKDMKYKSCLRSVGTNSGKNELVVIFEPVEDGSFLLLLKVT